jgi:hypothetical protein
MKTDTEILDWLEKNSHRLIMHRGQRGKIKFTWAIRDENAQYHWQDTHATLRETVSAAIEHDQKGKK